MAKITNLISKSGYDWKFSVVGGVTRVNIETGQDIAHLDELDQKLWTVLSCPVQGLEFDERTLALMDADKDGKIRVNEVVAAAKWLREVLTDMDYLREGATSIDFSNIKSNTDEGKSVVAAARIIHAALGQNKESIALSDVADYIAVYEQKCKDDYHAAEGEPYTPPYGEGSDAAEAAVAAVRAKVADWFMRCKLVQFDADAAAALDVQVEKIAAISGNDLGSSVDEIASYPLARPNAEAQLPLSDGINPAWQAAMAALKSAVLDADYPSATAIGEAEWNAVLAKVDAYTAWKAAGATAMEEAIAEQVAAHAAAIEPVERLLLYCRDYFRLLHNYVVFKDFYNLTPGTEAIFQAGRLFIDQRCCDLCLRVSDMPKQLASAGKSGMYLLYCHCVNKNIGQEMDIVAAITDGDTGDLHEGKNAIFYDRQGRDWDATVTKIVDNPISVRQAFWSPYRKFVNWVTEKITKNAAEKESAQFDNMTAKADAQSAGVSARLAGADGTDAAVAEKKAPAFDIAKFAGIFAAVGMGLGMIGAALVSLGKGIMAHWYNLPLMILAVVVVISGPSMLLAWLKLRKRNLGPVLNANGWAINSNVKVNTTFGATLTGMAKYPKLVMKDPLADKKMPLWKKILIWVVVLAALFVCVFRLTQHRWPWQHAEVEEMVVVEEPAVLEAEAEVTVEALADEASDE